MRWIVLSPFTHSEDPKWIFEYIDPKLHTVEAVPSTYYHDRSRKSSSASDWLDYFVHGFKGFLASFGRSNSTGIITAFPQLALVIALLKKLSGRKSLPLIAWCFNLGRPYQGIKGKVARFCLSSVDIFVVHSTAEIEIYSKWLNLPSSRFFFVHLSAEPPKSEPWLEEGEPYVVALGTANRDYSLLTEALVQLGYKAVIVSGKYAIEHLNAPEAISFKSDLSLDECHRLAIHSRINVIPIADIDSPSGQVTVIESMMLGVPLIATECAGTTDYIENDVDGILVKPKDVESMRNALEKLWNDKALRLNLALNAKKTATEKFTFKAASKSLLIVMNQLEIIYMKSNTK
ncbi:glycosyltransferase family 4 protein [Methyloradius palustris]|uniref:Glycosyl transferase family 1 domain-containing protein n=1 Tax=Methyloradius palustris TaxID=2778876 RepID=A0A8D5JZZ9_9PROT|nr:glycosyltransferase family 4 protein [Methyloradius palustris]BCM24253.1 hypothetical protein ZMTM_05120 [Methyloradius palustris]